MKTVAPLVLMLSLSPAVAQEVPPQPEGFSLMEEGAKLLFRGLMTEMEPALDEMGRALAEIEPTLRDLQPAMRDLFAMVGDLHNYHPPVKLDNGDILIRRKTAEELRPEALDGPEIEL